MHKTIKTVLSNLGVNVAFAEECLAASRLSEQDLLDATAGVSVTTPDGVEKVHELNREIWRLRNLRRRVFDRRSFAHDVVAGLGFNIDAINYARGTGKLDHDAFEAMVVSVCRGKKTVETANQDLRPTEVAPVTGAKAADAEFSIEELVSLGFRRDVLSRCVHSGEVTWDYIDSQAYLVRSGLVSASDVEENLVDRACRGLSFPRQCQLRERLVRQSRAFYRMAA